MYRYKKELQRINSTYFAGLSKVELHSNGSGTVGGTGHLLSYQQTLLPGETQCAVYIDIHREASAPYVTSH